MKAGKVQLSEEEYHGSLMEMRQDDRFINFTTLLDGEQTFEIIEVSAAQLPARGGGKRLVPCARLKVGDKECKRRWLITAKCNQNELARRAKSNKPVNWKGLQVTLYSDPEVTFGSKQVGGIRIK